ncbi:DNA replication/repair protein RecF [Pleurocapsa sp. CCALA 161]|uniref:DNA replication/repair protein RecF n=1 Tax=Pleurocapsa sp. CCALA 161 TaxID=2107688 RepID=UPI000D0652EF|nr:DNA replication/repair protein RecF [Pleurocapsa sp. CCALA 161]PSB11973.1 DNA replication/repair protein RecF [Pleurocapsa sp. CCALA 161]
MYLKSLRLRSFRNYVDRQIEFKAQKTILVGNNAQGKSNLLEAVELLASLKSHRTSRDRELVLDSATVGQIEARVERAYGTSELKVVFRKQGRRTVSVNQENLRRQLDFLGVLNAVQFSSLDLDLVRGAPDARRSWLDGLLIQLEPVYASILQQYNQVLKQRNALLKKIRQVRQENESIELTTFEPQLRLWDEQLAAAGSRVARRRARVIARLAPIAEFWHKRISGETENLEVNYLPNVKWLEDDPVIVQQAFLAKIKERRMVEQYQGKTMVGTHRDEIELAINQTPARYYGSQGQQRTLVLALKLAELKLIEEVVGEPPLLLLDDVLAELDPNRQKQLLEVIGDRFQTIITTTHIDTFNHDWIKNSQILAVEAGKISEVLLN